MLSTNKEIDEFVFAREQFEMLVAELASKKAQSLDHGEIEALIDREGRETLRRLFQGYLDLRAVGEKKKSPRQRWHRKTT